MGFDGIDKLSCGKGLPPVEVCNHVEMLEITKIDDGEIEMNSMVFTD